MKKLLWTKGICYAYEEGVPVLNQVSTEFYAGEKAAVIGSNGSGKSTFFLNLNGVLTPDSGIIGYGNNVIGKKEKNLLRQHVGFVFQDADQQIIAPTVMAEVSFGPMNLKLERNQVRRRTEMALEAMNLTELSDCAPHNLSGGQKKRVSIADIIAMEPDVILFDEPTTALDPANQQMLEQVLEKLADAGKTLIVSTHDVDFAYRFADRILVFDEGQIIADDTPEGIFSRSDILARANLRLPLMMKITGLLKRSGILEDSAAPRTPEDLQLMLHSGVRTDMNGKGIK